MTTLTPTLAPLPTSDAPCSAARTTVDALRLTQCTYYRGRVALAAILKSLGVGRGDEVVIQAFTCVAVPEGVMASGARPVYADIEPGGCNVDPASLEERITSRTRAIVLQHTFGIPAQMDRVMLIAERAGIPVIEDCCHALASQFDGRLLGSIGVASFYSFEWGKPLVAGLGGAAVANEPELAERLATEWQNYPTPPMGKKLQLELQFRAFKVLYHPRWYWYVRAAFHGLAATGAVAGNFAMPAASVGPSPEYGWRMSPGLLRRLKRNVGSLDLVVQHSDRVVSQYRQLLHGRNAVPPAVPSLGRPCYARYPLLVDNKQRLLAHARENHIELADWYRTVIHPLAYDHQAAVHYEPESCPNAEHRARQIVSLPVNRQVDDRFLELAVEIVNYG